MATYNGEKYITEQLESIRLQKRQADEVIICDDCSTDSTYKKIKDYIKEHNLISWKLYLNDKNKGYSLNFSDAIKLAQGDIIFLADQDDIWLPDKISDMTAIMEKNEHIFLLASNVEPFYVGKNPQKVNYETFPYKQKLIKINALEKWIKPIRPGCSMCFRNSLLEKYDDIWFERYPHDCLLWGLAVLLDGAYLYNENTIRFRRHDSNASSRGGYSRNRRLNVIEMECAIVERMLAFQKKEGNIDIIKMLIQQQIIYKKRIEALKSGNLLKIFLLLKNIKYFGRARFWLTDMYYCIKE